MKSSGNSSARATARSPDRSRTAAVGSPTRKGFALTGPSVRLDPKAHAIRSDLADLRLADRVFAPHYAAALPRVLARPAALLPRQDGGGSPIVELEAGDRFEVLEFAGTRAWGTAPAHGLVGYVDADALIAPK